MIIRATPEFEEWLDGLTPKERAQVDDRLDRLGSCGHCGDMKRLGEGLLELRWRSGRRIYFAFVEGGADPIALMLLGGGKNGQDRDIAHARRILEREAP